MKTVNMILAISSLFLMMSCGEKQASKLEISAGFAIANSSFPAGLMLYGERTDGTKKFSTTLESSNSKTITLEKGDWRLSVIGWKGNGSTNPNFTASSASNLACGSQDVNLSNDSESVVINVSSAGCTAFAAEFDVQNHWATSCGAFYDYNLSANTYSDLTAASVDNFCNNMPMFLRSPFTMYRIFAKDTLENTLGMSSECISTTVKPALATLPQLPGKKFPFTVKLYKTSTDCAADTNAGKTFDLLDGLDATYSFDSYYSVASGSRLVLPSSITNRGKTPFMNQIPNLQCVSGNDCLQDPSATLDNDVNIDWMRNTKSILLSKKFNGTSCPANLLAGSKYFSLDSCSVQESKIRAQISRNVLSCQEPTVGPIRGAIIDFYTSGNFIYSLSFDSAVPSDVLTVFDLNGKFIKDFNLSGSNRTSLAATTGTNPRIFASSSTAIHYWDFTPASLNLGTQQTLSIAGLTQIDVEESGAIIIGASGTNLKTYAFPATTPSSAATTNDTIVQVQFKAGLIHVLTTGTNRELYQVPLTLGTIPGSITPIASNNTWINFYFDGTNYFFTKTGTNQLVRYSAANLTTPTASSGYAGTNTKGIVAVNDFVYTADTAFFAAYNLQAGSYALVTDTDGKCTEPITIASSTFYLGTVKDFGQYPLFNDGFDLTGIRMVGTNPNRFSQFFESLSDGDEDEYKSGGYLSKAQSFLSPMNITSLLSKEGSCSALAAKLSPAPKSLSLSDVLIDPKDGSAVTIQITASTPVAGTELIPQSMCDLTNFAPGSCPVGNTDFDLVLNGSVNHGLKSESFIAKVHCSSKTGTLEAKEDEPGSEVRMEKILWNTSAPMGARYEYYGFEKDLVLPKTRTEVVKVKKVSTSDLYSRKISSEITSSQTYAKVMEYQIDSGNIMTAAFNLADTPANFATNSTGNYNSTSFSFAALRDTDSFFTMNSTTPITAPACFAASTNNIYSSLSGSCSLAMQPSQMASGLNLSISSIDQLTEVDDSSDLFFQEFEMSP